jgi:hypothetical protein
MKGTIQIGSRVRLNEKHESFGHNKVFEAGHEFIVYGSEGMRGWNLIDDEGYKLDETAMISYKFELVSP